MSAVFLFFVLLAAISGVIGWAIGRSKGRGTAGFWLGGFLGFIGWIIVAVMQPSADVALEQYEKTRVLESRDLATANAPVPVASAVTLTRSDAQHTGRIRGWYAPQWLRRLGNWALNGWAVFAYVYLFAPIFVILLFSFNDLRGVTHPFNYTWQGFTFANWAHPFGEFPQLWRAMVQSLKIAFFASLIATAMGTLIAIALSRYRFLGGGLVNLLLVLPLTTPEICLGSSLLTLFLTVGRERGFLTILIAHVMFCVSFVALTVKARIRGFDWNLEDAAMDLGAPPFRTFRKVTMPLIFPGVIAAFMLSFSLSIDDYIITVFNAGQTITFPIQIFNEQKIAVPAQIDVLASMILLVSITLIGGATAIRLVREKRLQTS